MSEAYEVSLDDAPGVAEAIRRLPTGARVHLVRDGQPVADVVTMTARTDDDTVPEDCEVSAAELAALEVEASRRPQSSIDFGRWHAARFGAPTIEHDRDVHRRAGEPWPGEAFIRRHHPVANAS